MRERREDWKCQQRIWEKGASCLRAADQHLVVESGGEDDERQGGTRDSLSSTRDFGAGPRRLVVQGMAERLGSRREHGLWNGPRRQARQRHPTLTSQGLSRCWMIGGMDGETRACTRGSRSTRPAILRWPTASRLLCAQLTSRSLLRWRSADS